MADRVFIPLEGHVTSPEDEQKDAPGFWTGLGESLNPMPAVKLVGTALRAAGRDPKAAKELEDTVYTPLVERWKKAKSDFGQGHYSEAAGNALAGSIPMIGPAAAEVGDRLGDAPRFDKYGNQAPSEQARGVGNAVGTALGFALPKVAGKVGEAISDAARSGARRVYTSALKPSTRLSVGKANQIVDTGIREGIPVSEKGYGTAGKRVGAINEEIADKLQNKSDELGPVISPEDVASHVDGTQDRFAQQVNPQADLAALERSKKEFLNRHTQEAPYTKVRPGTDEMDGQYVPEGQGSTPVEKPMTLAEAQQEKVGTYRQLKDKAYGELKGADIEAQKALARGLKEEIVKRFPEIGALNAREGALIALEDQLARFVRRHGNTNIAAGPSLFTSLAKMTFENPGIKSRIAIALDRASRIQSPNAVSNTMRSGAAFIKPDADQQGSAPAEEPRKFIPLGQSQATAAPTASTPTVPETPETLDLQVQQLQGGKRRAVMFPKGSPSSSLPDGMSRYHDRFGNRFFYDPKAITKDEISSAVAENRLPEILGSAKEGLGAPDKSEIKGPPMTVVVKSPDGTEVQTTVTDEQHLARTLQAIKAITPAGGSVDVVPPDQVLDERQESPALS